MYSSKATAILAALILTACAAPTIDPDQERRVLDDFTDGQIRLSCESISCAGTAGWESKNLYSIYSNQDWNNLAKKVISIDFSKDITYFYLGRAAEELGYLEAALTYYYLGSDSPRKCAETNSCTGLDVDEEISKRIRITKEKRYASLSEYDKNKNRLNSWGIMSESMLNDAYSAMVASNYSNQKNLEELRQYITDRNEAKKNNITVIAQRNNRLTAEKKRAEEEVAKEKIRKAQWDKEFPYIAYVTCYVRGQKLYTEYCFQGSNGVRSELSVTYGGSTIVYNHIEIQQMQDAGNGILFFLPRRFSIRAQNSKRNVTLSINIIDKASNKKIFSEETSQEWGVVSIRN